MATLLLSYAGSAIGGLLLGPAGAAIGRAAGAIAGNLLDQRLFAPAARRAEGPRLKDLSVMSSAEGTAIPRLWGRMRVSGQVIWATRFEEVISTQTEKSGGKGGGGGARTKVTTYSYFANFAVALADGPIGGVGRIWADGKPLDMTGLAFRLHRGGENQQPDSLILAMEGEGHAPAYRGTAYIVFERMPLERFGNRLPQLSFEVFRPVSTAADRIRSVNLIPGASEFGYDPQIVTRTPEEGVTESENSHVFAGESDWTASLDDLQATCRNLEAVSLVVAWFGDDLRCGHSTVRPKVEVPVKATSPHPWKAGGLERGGAQTVSEVDGAPAYGGTPSDASVLRAIADLKARQLEVSFYPFLLMDIPAGNTLPDPYGAGPGQPAYPWRGRITCHPAPGRPGTPDKSAVAGAQVSAFFGTATADDFSLSGGEVQYSGPPEWSYRRMILHYAHLCALAGGVDRFLIGSEMRGLTTLRSGPSSYPAVSALVALADEVKAILPAAKVSYAADWSEYFGHHPQDGSSDVFFHLDPLWAAPAVDFVAIDNYMPLSDWRDGESHLDRAAGTLSVYDRDYLEEKIAGGEGFDWFYSDAAARDAQSRTPITDGAYGKPWVFRYKDLKGWWSNLHYDRPGGIESAVPTAWLPQSKPIVFTEAGCPAVDKGTNQPNVFTDPKSAESALPYYSSGQRDDFMLHRYVEAVAGYWSAAGPHNPVSSVYGAPMVEAARISFWAWDARPYPAFPALADVWSDGGNYALGHWLNGRIGAAPLSALVEAICRSYGFDAVDSGDLHGLVDGLMIDRIATAREVIEPLARAFGFDAVESGNVVRFVRRNRPAALTLSTDDLVEEGEAPLYRQTRAQESDLPHRLKLAFADSGRDYRTAIAEAQRPVTSTSREQGAELPCAISAAEASRRAAIMLEELWSGRETVTLTLPRSLLRLEPGDVLELDEGQASLRIWIAALTDGRSRAVSGRLHEAAIHEAAAGAGSPPTVARAKTFGRPAYRVLDLPLAGEGRPEASSWIAGFSRPWPGRLNLFRRQGAMSFVLQKALEQPAVIGTLLDPLPTGPTAIFDRQPGPRVRLLAGALSSVTTAELLGGANVAAIGSASSGYEIIQFRHAELIGLRTYRIGHLLRGQSGSEPEMAALAPAGSDFVLLDPSVVPMDQTLADLGLELAWRLGPAPRDHGDQAYAEFLHRPRGLGLRPWRPAHLRASRDASGHLHFDWIRRARTGGDSWEAAEVPLGEEREAYVLDILDGASVRRSIATGGPECQYLLADQIADFGAPPVTVSVRLAQLSQTFGRGAALERTFHV